MSKSHNGTDHAPDTLAAYYRARVVEAEAALKAKLPAADHHLVDKLIRVVEDEAANAAFACENRSLQRALELLPAAVLHLKAHVDGFISPCPCGEATCKA